MGLSDVWGIVQHGSGRWSGRLVRERSRHRPTLAFDAGTPVGTLPLATVVELGLAAPNMRRAVRCPAVLTSVVRRRDAVEVTFDPDQPWLLTESIPGLAAEPSERRTWVRVPTAGGIVVPVRVPGAEQSASHLLARLDNLSAGGVALLFPRAAEATLCASRVLVCTFSVIPGHPPRDWTCEVRNRTLQDASVRYGLEFVTEAYEPEALAPRFEPLWDCPSCHDPSMLADTHRYCPRCGASGAGAVTRLPDWDDLMWAERHRYAGVAKSCGRCGAAHASAAHYCGHCGTQLDPS